jgi:filamentous hemagglutinin family protein
MGIRSDRWVWWGCATTLTIAGLWIGVGRCEPAIAQSRIEPDETLGLESSVVLEDFAGQPVEIILGGAQRGQNLFHSFREFNVDADRIAYFLNSSNSLQSILARVTGANRSEILGTLGIFNLGGVTSAPDLFLINPNGIVFGPTANLDVPGSFVATTADGVQFGENGFFSATSPDVPSSLLAIDPSAFFFNQLTPGAIENDASLLGLSVPSGNSLILLGGNVTLDGGKIIAPGSHVDVGGLVAGTVELNWDESNPQLIFSTDAIRADVRLTNAALIQGGLENGDTAVYARNVEFENSGIGTAIPPNQGTETSQLGDITIDATGAVTLSDTSSIGQISFGLGDTGNITISARSLNLVNASAIGIAGLGRGNLGDITIVADTISLSGRNAQGTSGITNSIVSEDAPLGQSGAIRLQARQISLTDGALIGTSGVFNQGRAGNLTIEVADSLEMSEGANLQAIDFRGGEGSGGAGVITITAGNRVSLSTDAQINTQSVGQDAGRITIRAGDTISLVSGARLLSTNNGRGDSGNVILRSGDSVLIDGSSTNNRSGIFSSVGLSSFTGNRRAGDIAIAAPTITVSNGGVIQSNVGNSTVGEAGNIILTADSIALLNGGQVQSNLEQADPSTGRAGARGRAGNVMITASDALTIAGEDETGLPSSISTSVDTGAVGSGGTIEIQTGSLMLSSGGDITASTSGQGDAGDIIVNATDRIVVNGVSAANSASSIRSTVEATGEGQGGEIRLTTGLLTVSNLATLNSSTLGRGDAGNIFVTADRIRLDSQSTVGAINNAPLGERDRTGGNIRLETGNLTVRNGAQILTLTAGQGDAGNIRIIARDRILFDGVGQDGLASGAFSTVESTGVGDGGTIRVAADSLALTNSGQLVSSTRGSGDAGDVTVRVNDTLRLRNGGLIQSAVAAGGVGDGGSVTIRGRSLFVLDGSQIGTFVARPQRDAQTGAQLAGGQGAGGNIDIRTTDSITLSGTGLQGDFTGFSSGLLSLSERNALGPAGDITVHTRDLQIADGAIVAAGIFNAGGSGGSVTVEANNLEILNGGQILTNTRSSGRAGRINLSINDTVAIAGRDPDFQTRREQVSRQIREQNLVDRVNDVVINEGSASGVFANTDSISTGDGGEIELNTTNLDMDDGATISAQSQGTGSAGDVQLNVREQMQLTDSDVITAAPNSAGGDIQVNVADGFGAGTIQLQGDSDITTNSQGDGGNITLRATSIVTFDDSDILARSADARGGNITLQTPAFFGQGYQPDGDTQGELDGNDRVDVNADGELASGTITTPDTSVIQNSLTELPETAIDPDTLVANSCVVRSQEQVGTFTITGAGGLPQRPGDLSLPLYPTSPVRSVEEEQPWQPGEAIVEPQGVYQLEDGRIVLSRECE